MKAKKHAHYPDMQAMRRRSNLVCSALQTLAGYGIEVLTIKLHEKETVIEVADCPSLVALRSEPVGQGCKPGHGKTVKYQASVFGCTVTWSESV